MAGITATLVDTSGPDYEGVYKVERYTLTNGSPTIAASTGAGTGGTATISGNDASGQIVITTGTGLPGGGGTLAIVTLANTLAGTPSPALSAAGATAAALVAGTSSPWTVAATTTWAILAGSATASTAYTFNYSLPDAVVNKTFATRYVQGSDTFARGEGVSVVSRSFTTGTATIGLRPNFSSGGIELLCRL